MAIQHQGDTIGTYKDCPIYDWIVVDGVKHLYDRIAIEESDGRVFLAQMRDDELMLSPGLIYREEGELSAGGGSPTGDGR